MSDKTQVETSDVTTVDSPTLELCADLNSVDLLKDDDSEKSFKSFPSNNNENSCSNDIERSDDKLAEIQNNDEEEDDDDIRPGSCRENPSSDEDASSWDENNEHWFYDTEYIQESANGKELPKSELTNNSLEQCNEDLNYIIKNHVSKENLNDNNGKRRRKKDRDMKEINNPTFIPTNGKFYMHDLRSDDTKDSQTTKPKKQTRTTQNKSNDSWSHDLFDESKQKPISKDELIYRYGVDIRSKKNFNELREQRPKRRQNHFKRPNYRYSQPYYTYDDGYYDGYNSYYYDQSYYGYDYHQPWTGKSQKDQYRPSSQSDTRKERYKTGNSVTNQSDKDRYRPVRANANQNDTDRPRPPNPPMNQSDTSRNKKPNRPPPGRYSSINDYSDLQITVTTDNSGHRHIQSKKQGGPTRLARHDSPHKQSRQQPPQQRSSRTNNNTRSSASVPDWVDTKFELNTEFQDVIEEMPPLTERELHQLNKRPPPPHNPAPRFSRRDRPNIDSPKISSSGNSRPAPPLAPKRYSEQRTASDLPSQQSPSIVNYHAPPSLIDFYGNLPPLLLNMAAQSASSNHNHNSPNQTTNVAGTGPAYAPQTMQPQLVSLIQSGYHDNHHQFFIQPPLFMSATTAAAPTGSRLNQYSQPFQPSYVPAQASPVGAAVVASGNGSTGLYPSAPQLTMFNGTSNKSPVVSSGDNLAQSNPAQTVRPVLGRS